MAARQPRVQVNVRVDAALHRALEAVAREERRSVAQTARQLMEDGLRQRTGGRASTDDLAAEQLAALAERGRAFDWLAEEPDRYDETSGEPL
jgi:hypothetical protein